MASDPTTTDEYGLPTHPPCPFCDGHDTELVSPFGSVLSVAAFWCKSCHSAFELLKWRAVGPSSHGGPGGETGQQADPEKLGPPDD
jgi:hypothetical protein